MLLGNQRVNDRGHLEIAGCDTVDLAQQFGTPLYVIDEAFVRDNCRRYKAAVSARYPGETRVCYAGKAFLVQAMVRLLDEEQMWLDVASAGELYTATSVGFPGERILFHGNNKSEAEITQGIDANVGRFVVDNFYELRRLQTFASERSKVQNVLIRVTPGIDPHTHRRIRTGQEDTKFGVNISDGSALEAIKEALTMPNVSVLGIHCHVGSQLLDSKSHEDAIEVVTEFLSVVQKETGRTLPELNIGGGLGVRYLPEHNPPTYEEFAERVCAGLAEGFERHGVTPPVLYQEPGRALVAEAGTTLYTVGPTKRVNLNEAPGERFYVSVDGGMSDNPRPQLYDAVYSVMNASRAGQARDRVVSIAGKHCETDILVWNTNLGHAEIGDVLAVQTTGAYNHAMASNYNRFTRSTVVFVRDGQADVVYERETLDDVLRQDRLPPRFKRG